MKIGTRTILHGYHTFWLHPWFVAVGWKKSFGFFPKDPRVWIAFFVHDLGYWGKPNLDGLEGKEHPEWGAQLMFKWCDDWKPIRPNYSDPLRGDLLFRGVGGTEPIQLPNRKPLHRTIARILNWLFGNKGNMYWHDFVRYHSRFLAKRDGAKYSELCIADKLAITLYPKWLFMFLVRSTGEIKEYMKVAKGREDKAYAMRREDEWYAAMCKYVLAWWKEHLDLKPDKMAKGDSKSIPSDNGVWQ